MTRSYLVVFAKCRGSNFSGHAPDVPGCVSAGETLEEMEAMMREALEMHLEALHEGGATIPEPSTLNVEFKPEDFEDAEYFVVEKLAVKVPAHKQTSEPVRAA